LEHLLDALRHLPGGQRGPEHGIGSELLRHLLPVGAGEHRKAHAHEVRRVARSLHLRGHEALADVELEHLTLTCVEASAPEPAPDLEALEHVGPAPRPPLVGAAASALPRPPPAVRPSATALARPIRTGSATALPVTRGLRVRVRAALVVRTRAVTLCVLRAVALRSALAIRSVAAALPAA